MLSEQCSDIKDFQSTHEQFCEQRATYLSRQPVRRKADIMAFKSQYTKDKAAQFYSELAQTLVDAAVDLHDKHHETDLQNDKGNKNIRASIGLIRIANINNINSTAMQLFNADGANIPKDTIIHVACYHAKQLLLLRNSLENKLDRILDRSDPNSSIFDHTEIKQAISDNPAKNHIFVVLATPVAEVGRDHDYDWAIVEPSSMRSIIQLAGRVWRHRPDKVADTSNMLLLQYNLRYFKHPNAKRPIFTHPGFETTQFKPPSYDLAQIMPQAQLAQVDARARIQAPKHTKIDTLSDLEHSVMRHLLNNPTLNYVNAYWDSKATANRTYTYLQQISPFRAGTPQDDWLLIPRMVHDDEDTDILISGFDVYHSEDVFEKGLAKSSTQNKTIYPLSFDFEHPQVKPWLSTSLNKALQDIQIAQPDKSLRSLAITYSSVSLDSIKSNNSKGWAFHEFFGFVRQ